MNWRLRCPAAAVIDPNLEARLMGAGLPPDRVAHAAALLKDLVATNYGGAATGEAMAKVLPLVNELEALFLAGEEQP